MLFIYPWKNHLYWSWYAFTLLTIWHCYIIDTPNKPKNNIDWQLSKVKPWLKVKVDVIVKLPISTNLLIFEKEPKIIFLILLTSTHCCGLGPILACLQTPFQSGHQSVAKLTSCTFNQFVALLEYLMFKNQQVGNKFRFLGTSECLIANKFHKLFMNFILPLDLQTVNCLCQALQRPWVGYIWCRNEFGKWR